MNHREGNYSTVLKVNCWVTARSLKELKQKIDVTCLHPDMRDVDKEKLIIKFEPDTRYLTYGDLR